jgi:hypothetical protein
VAAVLIIDENLQKVTASNEDKAEIGLSYMVPVAVGEAIRNGACKDSQQPD